MKVLFTVCGRAGSKGLKNKNIGDFLGIPLVYYTLAAILLYKEQLTSEDEVYVSVNTDSKELVELVRKQNQLPVHVVNRKPELGGDQVPKVSVIKDTLLHAQDEFDTEFDMVVDLDITSPLRRIQDIVAIIEKKHTNSHFDVVFSVVPSRRNPYFNMVEKVGDYFERAVKSDFATRQQAPEMYDMNASMYAYAPGALLNKSADTFFLSNTSAVVVPDTAVLDIDSSEDSELMQVVAKYFYEISNDFAIIKNKAKSLVI